MSQANELNSGDLSDDSVASWLAFMALPEHERCLRLAWVSSARAHAAVMWRLCEHHKMYSRIGSEKSSLRVSAAKIVEGCGDFFGCSVSGTRAAMADLIAHELVNVIPHVDNIARKLWLNWPSLDALLKAAAEVDVRALELHWVAKNKAELAVMMALERAQEGQQEGEFQSFSTREIELLYRPMLGTGVDFSSVARAIKSLAGRGLVELEHQDKRAVRSMRLVAHEVQFEVEQFYQQDLQQLIR